MESSMRRIAIGFNGGKESLVILHMHLDLPIDMKNIIVFRVISSYQEFPEITDYINDIEDIYGFRSYIYFDMKIAIEDLKTNKGCDRVILGNRRTDPNSQHLEYKTETDSDWPSIMRIFPVLDWTYDQIWKYIIFHKLSVCKLYKQGYTSIGYTGNTFPNYTLFDGSHHDDNSHHDDSRHDDSRHGDYRHAITLKDDKLERIGRIKAYLPVIASGIVIKGNGNGKKLGCPTANLKLINPLIIDDGVYYGIASFQALNNGRVVIDEKMVMSIGTNPSVEILKPKELHKSCEVHIISSEVFEDFYGACVNIKITGYIRPMFNFEALDGLMEAIKNDIKISKFNLKDK